MAPSPNLLGFSAQQRGKLNRSGYESIPAGWGPLVRNSFRKGGRCLESRPCVPCRALTAPTSEATGGLNGGRPPTEIVIVFVLYHLCRRLSRPAPCPALKAATLAPLSSLEPERDETCERAPSSGLGSSRSETFRV